MSMLSAFFDEESQREMHDRALKAKARAEGRAEGKAEGRVEGILQTLSDLVKSGLLSLSDAAKQAKMTDEEFANTPQMKDK